MTKKILLKSPAKLNLSLDILDVVTKNKSQYHLLKMITQIIDLVDYIEIFKSGSKKINIYNTGISIPLDRPEDNIIYKAALKFFDETKILFTGVDIKISKNIPVQAGLGGGSSNAATTLIGLNKLFEAGLSKQKLQEIGSTLGADVPLFFESPTCLCEGIGEIITPLPDINNIYFVIIKPEFGFSTAQVYKSFDKIINIKKRPDINKIIKAISNSNIFEAKESLYNVLEEAIDNQEIFKIKKLFEENGAVISSMTGSGSAVFGIFRDKRTAQIAFNNLKNLYSNIFLSKPFNNLD
ncbi:MAG: 4-(cytidine 5'-diphospho)-2-C-methyl-D-erythritol kinase [Oscillospiraceae bacterium]|nr:4-(cytidine 5'-diphospho)-2-C-methyl-D-erythritol kinase [Oscillospiraceae bacterium]